MLKNLLKVSIRNILKNTSHTLINVLGLSVGTGCAIIVFFILRFDLSFDNYHNDPDQIYRLVREEITNGESSYYPGIPYPLRLSFKEDFPEVKYLTYVDNNMVSGLVTIETNGKRVKYDEDDQYQAFVMPDFFKIFKYVFLTGGPDKALAGGYSVVLTKSLAQKYFGDYTKAVGKAINVENYFDLTVTAVVEDPPMNTDLPFKMLMSFDIGKDYRIWDSWNSTSTSVQAYIKLNAGVDGDMFDEKIKNYIEENKKPEPRTQILSAQPLSTLHFDDRYENFSERTITTQEIWTLGIVGLLILLAACINFINLNTALAFKRAKEIGVRKVLGSSRKNIIIQFICETGIITFLSLLISLGLAELFSIKIETIIGYDLPPTIYDGLFFTVLGLIFLAVTLFSGLYPAFVISGFKPISSLKEKIHISYRKGFSVRSSLIVVQLFISQALIIAIIVISLQIEYFMNKPIGVDTEALVEFSIPDTEGINLDNLRERLSSIEGIARATFSNTGTASTNTWGGIIHFAHDEAVVDEEVQVKLIDRNYLDTYGLTLLAGRNINSTDTVRRYLINESAMQAIGLKTYEEALGQEIEVWGQPGPVIGIVKDFNTMPLHYKVPPVAMWMSPNVSIGTVKIKGTGYKDIMAQAQQEWEATFPQYIFSYDFLDDKIAGFYDDERRISKIFSVFAVVAVAIGCIGLFGLMSYMINTRTKEIGVRKVLGAKAVQIISILSKDFAKLVFIAFILAVPLSWYLMNNWLRDFESHITIRLWMFALALGISAFITIATISYKSIKATLLNPVDVLKDE